MWSQQGAGRDCQLAQSMQLPFGLCFSCEADVHLSQLHEAGRAMLSCPEQTSCVPVINLLRFLLDTAFESPSAVVILSLVV